MEKTQEVFFMVKHIILWQLKDELSAAEKERSRRTSKPGWRAWQGRSRALWRCM